MHDPIFEQPPRDAAGPARAALVARLRDLCETIASRQEKVLVFTQFRETTGPLAAFLEGIFARPGLVLHGGTAVAQALQHVPQLQSLILRCALATTRPARAALRGGSGSPLPHTCACACVGL